MTDIVNNSQLNWSKHQTYDFRRCLSSDLRVTFSWLQYSWSNKSFILSYLYLTQKHRFNFQSKATLDSSVNLFTFSVSDTFQSLQKHTYYYEFERHPSQTLLQYRNCVLIDNKHTSNISIKSTMLKIIFLTKPDKIYDTQIHI